MKTWKWITAVCATSLVAGIVFVFTQPISDSTIRSPVGKEFAHAVHLRMALHDYAMAHDGRFPSSLAELPPDAVWPEARRFHDPETKQEEDWIYYPGYRLEDSPLNVILAAPRIVGKHTRIVLFSDCSAELVEENNFVRQLSRQLNRE